jgi:hypothetical protein
MLLFYNLQIWQQQNEDASIDLRKFQDSALNATSSALTSEVHKAARLIL